MRHTKTSYKLISLALCLTMLLPLAGCGESKQEQAEIFAMDTYMTLTAYGKNATAGLNAAKSVITSMDSMLDPELETSTTYAINHAEGASVVVPGQVARMLNTAQTIYKQSGGALDLTTLSAAAFIRSYSSISVCFQPEVCDLQGRTRISFISG